MPPLPGDVVWFPNEIRKLINAIKKQEGIFNPRHPDFGLREALAKAWKEVAAVVGGGKTDAQCRDKWNCLRGTYRRHVRTEASNSVKRRSGWPWTDHLTFIKKYVMDKDELAELEREAIRKGRKPPPSPTVEQLVKKHKPICPMATNTKIAPVTTTSGTPTVAFNTGGIYSGGIIFNRSGIGIVQPNQTGTIGIVQPSQGLRIGQPNVGLSLVQTSQGNILVRTNQTGVPVTKATEVDLSKVKKDQDDTKSPAKTEFVDMEDIVVKKEPMDEDEIDLPDFNFLPEESSQDSTRGDKTDTRDVSDQSDSDPINPSTKEQSGLSEPEDESTQLFMRSTVAHMKLLSPYDQSVFKLKVQQLLHDMMFPSEARSSQN